MDFVSLEIGRHHAVIRLETTTEKKWVWRGWLRIGRRGYRVTRRAQFTGELGARVLTLIQGKGEAIDPPPHRAARPRANDQAG